MLLRRRSWLHHILYCIHILEFIIGIESLHDLLLLNHSLISIHLFILILLVVITRFFIDWFFHYSSSNMLIWWLVTLNRSSNLATLVNWVHICWKRNCWRVEECLLAHFFTNTTDTLRWNQIGFLRIGIMKVVIRDRIVSSFKHFWVLLIDNWAKRWHILNHIYFISLNTNERFAFLGSPLMMSP